MINDSKNSIDTEYKNIITQNTQNKWDGAWEILNHDSYSFFKSKHNIGSNVKTMYHFIYNIYP